MTRHLQTLPCHTVVDLSKKTSNSKVSKKCFIILLCMLQRAVEPTSNRYPSILEIRLRRVVPDIFRYTD